MRNLLLAGLTVLVLIAPAASANWCSPQYATAAAGKSPRTGWTSGPGRDGQRDRRRRPGRVRAQRADGSPGTVHAPRPFGGEAIRLSRAPAGVHLHPLPAPALRRPHDRRPTVRRNARRGVSERRPPGVSVARREHDDGVRVPVRLAELLHPVIGKPEPCAHPAARAGRVHDLPLAHGA